MEDDKDTITEKWVTFDGEISDEEIEEARKEFFEIIQTDKEFVATLKKLPKKLWKEIEDMAHAEGIKIVGEDDTSEGAQ